jgi:hypothetical protein
MTPTSSNSNQKNERAMKIFRSKARIILFFAGIFVGASCFLPFFAMFFAAIGQGGKGRFVEVMARIDFALVVFANWPNFLLRTFPTKQIVGGGETYAPGIALLSAKVHGINAIGWALFGFIIGLIISAVKERRRAHPDRGNIIARHQ